MAVGLALGGAGIAFAASSSGSSTTTLPNPPLKPGHGSRGLGRGFGGFGGLGPIVHGQFTMRTASGGYQTVTVQVGKAAPVSPTSISVTSTDGYTHTYAVSPATVVDSQRDGISSVARQDEVRVIATQAGSKDTATNIADLTKLQSSRTGFGFGPGVNRGQASGFTVAPTD